MSMRNFWSAVISFLLCLIGSIMFGFIEHGDLIFNSKLVYFQFVAAGLLGSVFVFSAITSGTRAVVLVGLAACPLMITITGSNTGTLIIQDAVWIFGLAGSVLLALWNNRFFSNLKIGKFIVWGAIFGVLYFCMFAILSFVNGGTFSNVLAFNITRIGALIGVGIGLGYELAELVKGRINPLLD